MLDTLVWMAAAATLVPAHQAARKHPAHFVALVALELVGVAMVLLAAVDEPRWSSLAQEDGPVEWITFLAFALAGWLLLTRVRKLGTGRLFFSAAVLLALFCFGVAGEEISWGQRLFGFKPPEVFLDRNFQQELNVHNVLMHEGGLGFKLESKHLVMAIAVGFSLAWPLFVRLAPLRSLRALAPPLAFLPIGLAVFAAEVSYSVDLTGEGAEMLCGLLFLAAALVAPEPTPSHVSRWLAGTVAAGAIIALAVARLVFGSDDAGRALARQELELVRADVQGGGALERLTNRNIHKRLFTSVRDGYLALGGGGFLEGKWTPAQEVSPGATMDVRSDRRGYFLDPWNNPYWIVYDRRARGGALYSFGPNRRRDVNARQITGAAGDDIVVTFTLPEK